MPLESDLVPECKYVTLGLLALCLESDDRRLPDQVVVLADPAQLRKYSIVEVIEKGVYSGYLPALHLLEGLLQESGLLLDVLHRQGGVGFEELQSLGDAFEE